LKELVGTNLLLLLLLSTVLQVTNSAAGQQAPPHVFVDAGACPFECCTYRKWTTKESTEVFDRPKGTKLIATLSKGDVVQGLTGQVISVPIAAKAERDIPETPIKSGDMFYVLHYEGEGYWKVWFRGRITHVHQSIMDVPQPKAEWWVKIRDSHGTIGWALSHHNFEHQDACE
jgi:hypothetical protein